MKMECGGESVDLSGLQGSRVVFQPGQFAVYFSPCPHKGGLGFRLLKHQEGVLDFDLYGGGRMKAIYFLEGDKLTVCVNEATSKRPTAFTTSPKNGWCLYTLQRGEPTETLPVFAAQVTEEQKKLRGRWKVVAAAPSGKWAEHALKQEWRFKGNWLTIIDPGAGCGKPWNELVVKKGQAKVVEHPAVETCSYRDFTWIDPTSDPKRLTILIDLIDEEPGLAIYSLEGNVLKLRIRWSETAGYPSDFSSKLDEGMQELTLERIDKK